MRNQGLDILRGLAVLLVLVNHVDAENCPGFPDVRGASGAAYWALKGLGWSGVDLFFVLSGFLISGLIFKEVEQTGGFVFGRFWVRRAFKILPSYFVLLAVLAATQATPWLDTTQVNTLGSSLASHLLFVQNYLASKPNGPTWSLAVEEHFYIVMPLLLMLLARGATPQIFRRRVLNAGLFIVAVVFMLRCLRAVTGIHPDDFMLTHLRFDSLTLGVLVQLAVRNDSPWVEAVRRRPWAGLIGGLALVTSALLVGRVKPPMFTVGYTVLAVGYALILVVMSQGFDLRTPGRAGRILAKIGTWSYNIYLWHFFLIMLPIPGYASIYESIAAHVHGTIPTVLADTAVFFAVSIAVGALMTYAVEMPILKLRDRFAPAR